MEGKIVLGAAEEVTIESDSGESKKVIARIDTGALLNSIDVRLAGELRLGPIVREKKVKSASGRTVRPVITAWLTLKGKRFHTEFTIIDRSQMKYPVLIGRNILKNGYVIDVNHLEKE